jgi:NADPH:quinone reductase-like Zn-dependent oxidoreductase
VSIKIVQSRFGGPEVLDVVDAEPPKPADVGPDEVLVRVAFAGVNQIDVMTRTGGGMAAAGIVRLPFTPGWDLAGTIEAVGSDVHDLTSQLSVGQRVFGLARFPTAGNAYTQHALVPARDLVTTPDTLSDEAAGAFPMAAMTAWQAFADTTHIEPGQRVLITGAGGGVGHLAVQLAHHLGAHVTAVASTGKHAWLREIGADTTLDYADPAALAALATEPVDVALSLAAGSREPALAAVRTGGVLIALGADASAQADAAQAAGVRLAATHVRAEPAWLQAVAALAAEGTLAPTVSQVFDLAGAADAHRAIESGHSRGKVVLRA